jgi:type IV pilus assembly protein PilM
MFGEQGLQSSDTVVSAVPGDRATSRFLALPFSGEKKISQVVGFEFERLSPVKLEESVLDHQVQSTDGRNTRLLVCSVPRAFLEERIALLRSARAEPAIITHAPLALFGLRDSVPPEENGATAILDIGHRSSDLCVFDSQGLKAARTISCGGRQVTAEISSALGVPEAEAERVKHSEAAAGAGGALGPAVERGLGPLVRELRLSLASCGSVGCLYLCGGGSKLRGIEKALSSALDVIVRPFPSSGVDWNRLDDPAEAAPVIPKGLALALRVASRSSGVEIDFRKGPFAYEGDFKFLRDKLVYLAVAAVLLIGVGGVSSYIRLANLGREQDALAETLRRVSKEVTGQETDDFESVLAVMQEEIGEGEGQVFPEITAFQVLLDVSEIMERVKLMKKGAEPEAGEEQPEHPPGAGAPRIIGTGMKPASMTSAGQPRPLSEPSGFRPEMIEEGPAGGAADLAKERQERLQRPPGLRVNLPAPPSSRPGTAGSGVPAQPVPPLGRPAGAGPEEGEGEAVEGEETIQEDRFFLELESFRADRKGVVLKGQANTIEALETFVQELSKHRCFKHVVTEDTDRVTFKRHTGWQRFQIKFTLDCSDKEKAKGDKGKKKPDKAVPVSGPEEVLP